VATGLAQQASLLVAAVAPVNHVSNMRQVVASATANMNYKENSPMSQTPFPTVFEVIRFIATGFDTKASNKQLDDMARDVFSDYRQIEPMHKLVLIAPLSKYVSSDYANTLGLKLQNLSDDYLKFVSSAAVDGITREQVLPVLISHWVIPNGLKALTGALENLPNMPSVFLLLGNSHPAIQNVLDWCCDNVEGWTESLSVLPKEQKDQLANWRKAKYLPDLQSLHLFMTGQIVEGIPREARERIMGLLVLARAIDSLRSLPLGEMALDEARVQLMGVQPTSNPNKLFEEYQQDARQSVQSIRPHLGYLSNHLRRTISKSEEVQSETRKCLDDLTNRLKALGEYETSKHKVAQLEGRWHVFSGDLRGACKYYGLAVEAALYRAGDELKDILEEAFCVAAKSDDSVLMRNVQNSKILFKVDLVSVNQQLVVEPSKKIEQFVQGWEIKTWAKQFEKMFPNSGLFVNVPGYEHAIELGPILYSASQEVKPDYRYPNRKIKVGISQQKTWPQICWFILQDRLDVVEKLIEKGASMDVVSSSGDTPLIMALEKLAFMQEPLPSLDDRFALLVLSSPKVEMTVNLQSQKLKLTPIIQAVYACRPDIVRKLLELDAKVDLRGDTDGQTALNVCIKLIGALKRSNNWKMIQKNHPLTPEVFDALRRHSNGLLGADLSSQKAFMEHPDFWADMERYNEVITNRLLDNASLGDLRVIFDLLVRAGADPNTKFQSPRPGFTPTMLAVELDLKVELELMLMHGADLDLTSTLHPLGREENSWQIAKRCQSQNVLRLMEGIKPYYTVN